VPVRLEPVESNLRRCPEGEKAVHATSSRMQAPRRPARHPDRRSDIACYRLLLCGSDSVFRGPA